MFIELTRVDGVVALVNTDHIETANASPKGTMLIMHSGTIREVTESYDVIKAACGIGELKAGKLKKK